jgi:Domain of unknown function (DUF4397)
MTQFFSKRSWLASLSATLILAACGGGSSNNNTVTTPAPTGATPAPSIAADKAGVRTANVLADPSTAWLDVNGTALNATNIDAPVSDYAAVAPGTIDAKLNVSAEASVSTGSASSTSQAMSMSAAAGDRVTVLAVGDANASEAIVYKHDKEVIPADKTGVRVLHAARRVADVDIYLSAPGDTLPAAPTIAALAFRKFAPPRGEPSLKVAAGDARVRVTLAGSKDVVFDSGTLALPGGKDLLVAAIPNFDGVAPIALLLLSEDSKPVIVREPRAGVRAIHASPDTPAVDVLVNDKVTFADVMYRDASRYKFFAPGKANVKVNLAGTTTTAITADLDLADKTFYSVFAVDKTAKVAPLVIADDGKKPDSGKAKVRVLHASPDVPAVDVYVDLFSFKKPEMPSVPMTPASGASAPAPGASNPMGGASSPAHGNPWAAFRDFLNAPLPATPAIPGLAFKDAVPKSGDAALQLDAGLVRIRVTLAGAKDVVFDSGPVPLFPRESLIFAAVQPKAGAPMQKSPVDLLAIGTRGGSFLLRDRSMMETAMGSAEVRAGHFSPDAPNVDVIVDGTKALSDVPFGAISNYLKLPAGKRDIKVNVTGTQTTAIAATPTLMRDQAYSLFAINFVSTIKALVTVDQRHEMKAGMGFVRVIHASPDAPAVDVLAGGKLALPSVKYETVSAYLPVAPGKVKFAIALPGTTTAVKEVEVEVKEGVAYTVAAIGALDTAKAPAGSKALSLVAVRDSSE